MKRMAACVLAIMISVLIPLQRHGTALAMEVKVKGLWELSLDWGQGWAAFNNTPTLSRDTFLPTQRLRVWTEFVASEHLKGLVWLETGGDWGYAPDGGALGTNGKSVKVKHSYIDWTVPDTDLTVRMGLQRFAIPGLMRGNAILGENGAGIMASYPFSSTVSATAFWMRPWNDNAIKSEKRQDEADFFGFLLPVKTDGLQVTPWLMYGSVGANAFEEGPGYRNIKAMVGGLFAPLYTNYGIPGKTSGRARAFWAGAHAKWTAQDPFRLEIEADYGNVKGYNAESGRKGWLLAGLAEYRMEKVTPGLLFWYGSGDDDNIHNGSENLPMLAPEWAATSMGYGRSIQTRGVTSNALGYGPSGTWALGAQVTLFPLEKLMQEARIVYLRGTNDKKNARYATMNWDGTPTIFRGAATNMYLTENDSAWEANLSSLYQIEKNLDLAVELGYLKLNLDDSIYPATLSYKDRAYRISVSLLYKF